MPDLQAIQQAIASGDKRQARQMLKPLLDTAPTADLWLLAADACESQAQEIGCVRQALKLNSHNAEARRRYNDLRKTAQLSTLEMPELEHLVADLDMIPPPLEALVPDKQPPVDIFALKREKQKEARRRWNRIGCVGSMLMSLSLSYFVLTVIGSPIPVQIRQVLSGGAPVSQAQGTPIFGKPLPGAQNPLVGQTVSGSQNNPASIQNAPGAPNISADGSTINGTPIAAIMTLSPTHDAADTSYSDEASQAGFVVSPSKTATLTQNVPVSDILDPGFAHEYTFAVSEGQEADIAVQFLSPSSKNVGANVAILDPDGYNAESYCERDAILKDGSSVAFICKIHKTGNWKVQLFGRADESSGVYILSFDAL